MRRMLRGAVEKAEQLAAGGDSGGGGRSQPAPDEQLAAGGDSGGGGRPQPAPENIDRRDPIPIPGSAITTYEHASGVAGACFRPVTVSFDAVVDCLMIGNGGNRKRRRSAAL